MGVTTRCFQGEGKGAVQRSAVGLFLFVLYLNNKDLRDWGFQGVSGDLLLMYSKEKIGWLS